MEKEAILDITETMQTDLILLYYPYPSPLSLYRLVSTNINEKNKPTLGVAGRGGVYLGDLLCLRIQITRRIITQWSTLHTRLVRQKIINPNKAFTNLLASRLDDVRDCLILLDLILTLSSSAAKCERRSLKE